MNAECEVCHKQVATVGARACSPACSVALMRRERTTPRHAGIEGESLASREWRRRRMGCRPVVTDEPQPTPAKHRIAEALSETRERVAGLLSTTAPDPALEVPMNEYRSI